MAFQDFDIEIQDNKEATPEQISGNIPIAGTPVTINPISGNPIQLAYIHIPGPRDPDNPNSIGDALKISLDGGTNYTTIMANESIFIPGVFTNLVLDTNENTTTYQIILWT